jgi:hypothetical protein
MNIKELWWRYGYNHETFAWHEGGAPGALDVDAGNMADLLVAYSYDYEEPRYMNGTRT